jgi:hypothetical protein
MSADGFYFNVKQWLGDDAVLLMDWDVRAMHLHLMCIAWQKSPPGVLPSDDATLRKWLGNPEATDWTQRVRPQLLQAWREDGAQWRQEGLAREFERQASTSQKRRAAANARWRKEDDPAPAAPMASPDPGAFGLLTPEGDPLTHPEAGFSLRLLLKDAGAVRHEASQDERVTIWSLGVKALKTDGFGEDKARAYLGKLIQEHGEKRVAEAVASLSLKHVTPADAKSYLAGILRAETTKRRGRGGVAL